MKFTEPTEDEIARLHAEAKARGDTLVVYYGFCVPVQSTFLENAIYELSSRSRAERRRTMWSCRRSIEHKIRIMKIGKATKEDTELLANDIGIWLADQALSENAAQYRDGPDGPYRVPKPGTKKEPPTEAGG